MKNDQIVQLNLRFSVTAVTCHIAVWGFGLTITPMVASSAKWHTGQLCREKEAKVPCRVEGGLASTD